MTHAMQLLVNRDVIRGWALVFASCLTVLHAHAAPARQTRVSIVDGRWHINNEITHPDTRAEGLLLNVRMVNATFEDRNRPEFDADANTDEFIARIPEYVEQGVRAFTLNLQGGMPGYEGAVNSAFRKDGTLRDSYLRRVRRVIDECDRRGVVIILGCYYQRQDQILKNADAVRAGVVHVIEWIRNAGFTNVVLEISNEFDHKGFDHAILKTSQGQVELLQLAEKAAPELLVATSGLGHGRLPDDVARASDFLLIHFNGTPVGEIPNRIARLKKFGKPIVCNEDDKTGRDAADALTRCVDNGASYGLMLQKLNQTFPFEFKGAADDAVFYDALRLAATTGATAGLPSSAPNRAPLAASRRQRPLVLPAARIPRRMAAANRT